MEVIWCLAGTRTINKRKRKTIASLSTLEESPAKKQKKLSSSHNSHFDAVAHRNHERPLSPPSLIPEPSVPLPTDDGVRNVQCIEAAPLATGGRDAKLKPCPRTRPIADVKKGKSSCEAPSASPKALVTPVNKSRTERHGVFEENVPSSECSAFVRVDENKPSSGIAFSASARKCDSLKPSSLQASQSHPHGEGNKLGKDVRKTKVVEASSTFVALTTKSNNEHKLSAPSVEKKRLPYTQQQDAQITTKGRHSPGKSPNPISLNRRIVPVILIIACLALLVVLFPHRILLCHDCCPSRIDGYGEDSDSLEDFPIRLTHAVDHVKEVKSSLEKSDDSNEKMVETIESLREQLVRTQELLDVSHSTNSLQRAEISKMKSDMAELEEEKEMSGEERLQALREVGALQTEWEEREAILLHDLEKERQPASKLSSDWEMARQQLERELAAEQKKSIDYRGQASRQISDLNKTIADLKHAAAKDITIASALRKELEDTAEELQISKKISQEEISELEGALAARVNEVEQQRISAKQIRLELAELKEAHIASNTPCSAMQLALNRTLLELEEVQKSLDASQTSCDSQIFFLKSSHRKVLSRRRRRNLAAMNRVKIEASSILEEKDAKIGELLSNISLMEESMNVLAKEKDYHIQSLKDSIAEAKNQQSAALAESKQKHEAVTAALCMRNEFILQERAEQIRQLHATCTVKQAELDSMYRDTSTLRDLRAASEDRVVALESDLRNLHETLRTTKVLHNKELRSVKDMAEEEMSRASSKFDEMLNEERKQFQDLTIAFADTDALVGELRIQSESQNMMIVSLEAEIEVRRRDVEEMVAKMKAESSTHVTVATERDKVLEELSQLRKENEVMLKAGVKSSEELLAKLHNLRVEKDMVEKTLDAFRVTVLVMYLAAKENEGTMNGQSDQIHNLQVQRNETLAELEGLKLTLEAVEAERQNVRETAKKEVNMLKKELLHLSGINESLLLEIDVIREQSEFKDGQLSDTRNIIATLNASKEELKKAIDQSDRLHVEELQNAKAEVVGIAKRGREKIEELTNHIGTMKSDIKSKELRIQEQELAATALIDKLASSEERAANLVTKIKQTSKEYSESKGLCEEEITSLKAKVGSQAKELRGAERELESGREKECDVERRLYELIDMLDETVRMNEQDSEKWQWSSTNIIEKQDKEQRSKRFKTQAAEMEEFEKNFPSADYTYGPVTTNQEAVISADLYNSTMKKPNARTGYCASGNGISLSGATISYLPAAGNSTCSNVDFMSTDHREADVNLIGCDEKLMQLVCCTILREPQRAIIGNYYCKKMSNLSLESKKTCSLVCCGTEVASSENSCTIDEAATIATALGVLRNAILKKNTRQQKTDKLLEQVQLRLEQTKQELSVLSGIVHDAKLCLEQTYAACWLWKANTTEVRSICSPFSVTKVGNDTVKLQTNSWWNALGRLVEEATEIMLQ